jgi:hypothetical protein
MDSGCHTLHNSIRLNDGRCARVSEEECRLSQDLAQSGVSQNVTKGSMLRRCRVEEEMTHAINSSAAFMASSGDCGLAYLPPQLGTEA